MTAANVMDDGTELLESSFMPEMEQPVVAINFGNPRLGRIIEDDWVLADDKTPAKPQDVQRFMQLYFVGLEIYCGGPIPVSELLSPRHIDMVLRLELSECIDIFYACLSEVGYGLTKVQWDAYCSFNEKITVAKQEWNQSPHPAGHKMPNPLSEEDRKIRKRLRDKLDIAQMDLAKQLQDRAYRLAIPRHHSGGLLLVWLRLCMGFDL